MVGEEAGWSTAPSLPCHPGNYNSAATAAASRAGVLALVARLEFLAHRNVRGEVERGLAVLVLERAIGAVLQEVRDDGGNRDGRNSERHNGR